MISHGPLAQEIGPDERPSAAPPRKVLAVSSGGGHWVQLLRLSSAFRGLEVVFATTDQMYAEEVPGHRLHVIPDATRWDRGAVLRLAWAVTRIVVLERPDVVISTGAAPGVFSMIVGRILGARTIWVESAANVERLSLSGRLVRPFAALRLTQWPHLTRTGGPHYAGRLF